MKISELLLKYSHSTDKNRGMTMEKNGHCYGNSYDKLFLEFDRLEKLNILEIGVEKGASLEVWKEYFPNSNVYGVDIVDNRQYKNDNITFILSDIKNITDQFDNILFDIIIDDGSHLLSDVLFTVSVYSKKLKKNGILVVEDVQSTMWISEIEKKLIDGYFIFSIDLRNVNNYYDDFLVVIKNK